MVFDYDTAARAMQQAARCERETLVSDPKKLPSPSRATLVPFVGWIGPEYAGGTVVIGKDPGGFSEGDQPSRRTGRDRDRLLDEELEDALLTFRKHPDPSSCMRKVSDLFLKQMQYNGMRVVLSQIASACDEPVEAMAFFNLCPFRTHGPSLIKGLKQIAIPLVPALSAHTVLILNKTVADDLAKLRDRTLGAKWLRVLHRHRSDNAGLHDDGLRTLQALAEDAQWRGERHPFAAS